MLWLLCCCTCRPVRPSGTGWPQLLMACSPSPFSSCGSRRDLWAAVAGPDEGLSGGYATMASRRWVGRRGGTTRPPGRISPMSSNTITPLHSRLHPCSGWMTTVWAASRSGRSAGGHGGRCQHIAHLWSGLRMYLVLWAVRLWGWSCKKGTNRRSLWASPDGAHAGGIFRSRPAVTTVPRDRLQVLRGDHPAWRARATAPRRGASMWWHSADQRGGGRGARRLESRIQQRSWPSLDRGTARTGGWVAGLQLASLSLRSGRGCCWPTATSPRPTAPRPSPGPASSA